MQPHEEIQLAQRLKALGDDSRFALFRLLVNGERSVSDLAEALGLRDSTVSHHLAKLRGVGLVALRMEGNLHYYSLSQHDLAIFKQQVARIHEPLEPYPVEVDDQSWIDALGWPEDQAGVLREYTFKGRLRRLPVRKQKPLKVILRWLVSHFDIGREYTEAEVNEQIKAVYEKDYVSLRRDLINYGYLLRDDAGSRYHRPAELPPLD